MKRYRLTTFFSSVILGGAGLALSVWLMKLGRFSGLWWFIFYAVWLLLGLRGSLTERAVWAFRALRALGRSGFARRSIGDGAASAGRA